MAISAHLQALDDDALVALLRRRPDLAAPSPVTMASLAARATSRVSLERALAGVDAAVLQAIEAVVALAPDGPPSRARVLRAIAGDRAEDADLVGHALDEAIALALVWPEAAAGSEAAAGPQAATGSDAPSDEVAGSPAGEALHAAPGLAELFAPYPAGLAPAPDERLAPDDRLDEPAKPGADARTDDLAALGADERAVLDALTWGPPVGLVPAAGNPALPAIGRLLEAGLLVRGGARQVVLPRAVALALRGGRTHRAPERQPVPEAPVRAPEVVAAESAGAAERIVRLVVRLVNAWGEQPPAVLRSGGLGVRDLRRLAGELEVDEAEAAFVAELAGLAGLVADDGEERPSFVPTDDADTWLRRALPQRWAGLTAAWMAGERAPWLVGTRGERGTVRAALEPELHRRWVPRVRAATLGVLAGLPEGTAPGVDEVLAALRWRTPRNVPPAGAVTALLVEAGRLGVTGAGALSPAGRALLAAGADGDGEMEGAFAMAASLPPPVGEVLLQGDLTGIVPGRPSEALDALLDRVARVESRGGAVTVRFTPETVRGALDAGHTADELLAELAAVTRTGVPQPLEYLIRDTARRHGVLRAGVASSYLRSDDPALLAGLPDDPRLASLGLRLLAPTVAAAAVPPADLVAALRLRGLAPVVEGPDGLVVHAAATAHRVRVRARRQEQAPDEDARLAAVVARLRRVESAAAAQPSAIAAPDEAGTRAAAAAPPAREGGRANGRPGGSRGPTSARVGPSGGTGDTAAALLVLREAAADRALVWVEVVGGRGVLERRLLRPVSVEAGRLRAVDPAREAELVVAVHRIAAAERAS